MEEYPKWIFEKRKIVVRGSIKQFDPTEVRIELRKGVWDILRTQDDIKEKADAIIDCFKGYYKGIRYQGLGKKQRRDLFIREKGICRWCKVSLPFTSFTIEHLKPRVEGGEDDIDNYGIACERCNHERGPEGDLFDRMGFLKKSDIIQQ